MTREMARIYTMPCTLVTLTSKEQEPWRGALNTCSRSSSSSCATPRPPFAYREI